MLQNVVYLQYNSPVVQQGSETSTTATLLNLVYNSPVVQQGSETERRYHLGSDKGTIALSYSRVLRLFSHNKDTLLWYNSPVVQQGSETQRLTEVFFLEVQ